MNWSHTMSVMMNILITRNNIVRLWNEKRRRKTQIIVVLNLVCQVFLCDYLMKLSICIYFHKTSERSLFEIQINTVFFSVNSILILLQCVLQWLKRNSTSKILCYLHLSNLLKVSLLINSKDNSKSKKMTNKKRMK